MNKNINFRKALIAVAILSSGAIAIPVNLNAQNRNINQTEASAQKNSDNGADLFTQNYIPARVSIQNEYLENKRIDAFTDYMKKAIYMGNSISGDGLTNYVVQAYTSDVAINKIDNVFIQDKSAWSSGDVYKVNSIINYNIEIRGYDGHLENTVKYKKLLLEDGEGKTKLFDGKNPIIKLITDNIIAGKYAETRADKKYPTTIPEKFLSLKLYPNEYGRLIHSDDVDTGWQLHAKKLESDKRNKGITAEREFGGKFYDEGYADTDMGRFTIRLYKSEKCKKENGFDIVTVQKNGEAEFKIDKLMGMDGTFSNDKETIRYLPIFLTKPGLDSNIAIFNGQLWYSLMELKAFDGFDNAFGAFKAEVPCNYDENGKYIIVK